MNFYEIHLQFAILMIGVFLIHLMFGKIKNAWSSTASFGLVSVVFVYALGYKHDIFYYLNQMTPEELANFKEHAMYVLGIGLLTVILDEDGYSNANISFAIMFLIGELFIYGTVSTLYFVLIFFTVRGFNEIYDGIVGR